MPPRCELDGGTIVDCEPDVAGGDTPRSASNIVRGLLEVPSKADCRAPHAVRFLAASFAANATFRSLLDNNGQRALARLKNYEAIDLGLTRKKKAAQEDGLPIINRPPLPHGGPGVRPDRHMNSFLFHMSRRKRRSAPDACLFLEMTRSVT
jgi:hypothetical protein